jgi:hypothetical protein
LPKLSVARPWVVADLARPLDATFEPQP